MRLGNSAYMEWLLKNQNSQCFSCWIMLGSGFETITEISQGFLLYICDIS